MTATIPPEVIEAAAHELVKYDGTWYDGDPSAEHWDERMVDVRRIAPLIWNAAIDAAREVAEAQAIRLHNAGYSLEDRAWSRAVSQGAGASEVSAALAAIRVEEEK